MRPALVAVLVGVAACGGRARPVMRVRIDRGPKDSTLFTAASVAHPCRGGGVLLDAVDGPNGVLAWVKTPSPPAPGAGSYPLLGRADTSTPRGAVVAVRFISHEVAHGFPVDSGTLVLSSAGTWYRGRIQGAGTDLGSATRGTVDITIDSVRPRADTIACGAKE